MKFVEIILGLLTMVSAPTQCAWRVRFFEALVSSLCYSDMWGFIALGSMKRRSLKQFAIVYIPLYSVLFSIWHVLFLV